jgi:hypothetical protein
VFTWSLPTLPGSGTVDPAWYTAYRFVVKSTDDGAVGGSPRNEYTACFVTADLDVDLDGTLTKAGTLGWEVVKETPIAVDDSITTPVAVLRVRDPRAPPFPAAKGSTLSPARIAHVGWVEDAQVPVWVSHAEQTTISNRG